VTVDAVVYFRIQDAVSSVCNVDNVKTATRLLAQTTLRYDKEEELYLYVGATLKAFNVPASDL